jgi:hypothetical protein
MNPSLGINRYCSMVIKRWKTLNQEWSDIAKLVRFKFNNIIRGKKKKIHIYKAKQRTKLGSCKTTCISVISNSDSILFSFESQKGCDRSKCFLSRVRQIGESTKPVSKKLFKCKMKKTEKKKKNSKSKLQ